MKDSMDMKSLPKLGATKKRTRRGKWSISDTRIPLDSEGKPIYGTPITKSAPSFAKSTTSKYLRARNAHEARQIVRYTQKANVLSSAANLEEQRARIRKARRSGRGRSELKRPFQGKIKYKGDRGDRDDRY